MIRGTPRALLASLLAAALPVAHAADPQQYVPISSPWTGAMISVGPDRHAVDIAYTRRLDNGLRIGLHNTVQGPQILDWMVGLGLAGFIGIEDGAAAWREGEHTEAESLELDHRPGGHHLLGLSVSFNSIPYRDYYRNDPTIAKYVPSHYHGIQVGPDLTLWRSSDARKITLVNLRAGFETIQPAGIACEAFPEDIPPGTDCDTLGLPPWLNGGYVRGAFVLQGDDTVGATKGFMGQTMFVPRGEARLGIEHIGMDVPSFRFHLVSFLRLRGEGPTPGAGFGLVTESDFDRIEELENRGVYMYAHVGLLDW